MHLLSLCQCLRSLHLAYWILTTVSFSGLRKWRGASFNRLEIEQPWWPRWYLQFPDLTQGSGPGSTTWPPLKAYRNPCSLPHVLNANCVAEHCHFPQHSCRTQKKQCNQAPGIAHHCTHEKWVAFPQHSLFPQPILPAFTFTLSVIAIPPWSFHVAVTGMSKMR